jgi:anti-anti-sigma factor
MEIIQKENGGIVNFAIKGRLDAVTSAEAEKEFGKIFNENKTRLLVDLEGLEYISSAGLRILLVVAKRMQQKGGKVALCNLAENVREVFEISGFSSIFKIFKSVPETVTFLNG